MASPLWQAVLGEIEVTIPRASFATWFKNTTLLKSDGQEVVIGVPNVFTKRQLEEKYQSLLEQTLHKNGLQPEKITLPAPVETAQKRQTDQQRQTDWSVKPKSRSNTSNLNSKYTFDNFVVGAGNELAYAASQAIVKNPGEKYNPLFIYSGVGLGKTHLIQAIGNEMFRKNPDICIECITSERFTKEFIASTLQKKTFSDKYRSADVLIVDDMQFIAGKEKTEEEFFHTFNALHQANKQIIISSDQPPNSIPTLEERLRSRFEWGMTADIQPPDLETRMAIIQSKAHQHQTNLPGDVSEYLATHIRSNIRELEGALTKVLAHCEMSGQTPSIPVVEQVLGSSQSKRHRLTQKQIVEKTARYFNVTPHEIMSARREKTVSQPRQISMYLLRNELHLSFPAVAKAVGRKDHTTAIHSVSKIEQSIAEDASMRQTVQQVKEQLYA
ncbi:chromosomal replication initiator protein DnaA [Candidatus Saccharibacteria bacterium QS_8_54_8]|nr:MAG: chromosomal replication initiator protein DnaA [Candidatus Saccharibacteria bacterium QS_8_54_8]